MRKGDERKAVVKVQDLRFPPTAIKLVTGVRGPNAFRNADTTTNASGRCKRPRGCWGRRRRAAGSGSCLAIVKDGLRTLRKRGTKLGVDSGKTGPAVVARQVGRLDGIHDSCLRRAEPCLKATHTHTRVRAEGLGAHPAAN